MGWNPLDAIKKKFARAGTATAEPPPQGKVAPSKEDLAGLDGMDQQGLLPKFFRHWKNPAFLKRLRAVIARMQADGVNVKDKVAVQSWLKAHEKEIESGHFADEPPVSKPQTYVKTGPDIGRNDPCTCGSGKKYKKCCGAKA